MPRTCFMRGLARIIQKQLQGKNMKPSVLPIVGEIFIQSPDRFLIFALENNDGTHIFFIESMKANTSGNSIEVKYEMQ